MSAVEVTGVDKIFNAGKVAQVDALVGFVIVVEPGVFV